MAIGEGSIDYLPLLLNEQRIFSNTHFEQFEKETNELEPFLYCQNAVK